MNAFRLFSLLLLLGARWVALAAEPPWAAPERLTATEQEATLAQWTFVADETPVARLRGASRIVATEEGSVLECYAPGADWSRPGGARVANDPRLTPCGAFTLELWIRPKAAFFDSPAAYLLDKKYYAHPSPLPAAQFDYVLRIEKTAAGHRLLAGLGFGSHSVDFASEVFTLRSNGWSCVAFAYDAQGRGSFFVDDVWIGDQVHAGRGPIAAGPHPLVIGDRVGSNYGGFEGFIGACRIRRGVPPWLPSGVQARLHGGRTVFRRLEPAAQLTVELLNRGDLPARELHGTLALPGGPAVSFAAADLAAWERRAVAIPIPTDLKPGRYPVALTVDAWIGTQRLQVATSGEYQLVPRPVPGTLPIVMWGDVDPQQARQIGFTHTLMRQPNYLRIWQTGAVTAADAPEQIDAMLQRLDQSLALGNNAIVNLSPGRWLAARAPEDVRQTYRRIGRDGAAFPRDTLCARFPEAQRFACQVGASVAQTYGAHPALVAALLDSETRDSTEICHHEHDRAGCREALGGVMPREVTQKRGFSAGAAAAFVPLNGVVSDDQPGLAFLRWFWQSGDGWNALLSQTHRGFHATGRRDLWTFYDPAVRVPALWGSGGEVDVISQWTYSYPDPLRIGLATDQLFAMAAGRPGQQVMTMTQIIWYRNQTAPTLPTNEADRVAWERKEPQTAFVTIAPDHLREAFWTMLARPVRGIMFHGWGSLVEAVGGQYRLTHPGAAPVLTELIRKVAEPLGPALLMVPDPPADVAMLESATATFCGAEATWGWGGSWVGELYQTLLWARLQPKVIYEESILRDGLDGIRVLCLPNAPALPGKVVARILAFQRQGGVIVGDETLALGITPDVLLRRPDPVLPADRRKAASQAIAEQLRRELAPLYTWDADSSDPDVLVRRRRTGGADYLFAINDRRTFGDYVGQHGKVMEQGLPAAATLRLRRDPATVYDLLESREVASLRDAATTCWDVRLGPGEGRLFLLVPRPIARLEAALERRRPESREVRFTARVVDSRRRPIPAVVPMQVEILDPAGERAEYSGYYGARDGLLAGERQLAPNDRSGRWTIRLRELASGQSATLAFDYSSENQ